MAPGGIPEGGGMVGAPPTGGEIGAAVTGSFFLQPAMASAAARATKVRFKVVPPGASCEEIAGHARQSSLPAAGFKDGLDVRDPGRCSPPRGCASPVAAPRPAWYPKASMHIGFDAKRAFQNSTGLGNFARDVLRILAEQRPGNRYVAYGPRLVAGQVPAGVEARGPDRLFGRAFPSLWRVAGLAAQLRRDRVELFHGLSGELPMGIERSGVRSVVTIHDLIFERFPELYPPIDRRIYAWKSRRAAERAGLVIAVSEQTKQDLVERYAIRTERIRIVYQGCHPAFQRAPAPGADEAVARRLGLPDRYLLSVGTVERRKNLGLVVKALPGLPGIPLLAVGRQTGYADELRLEARRLGVEDRVRFLAGVSMEDLAALYRRCSVFVYPSIFEGFGIPIIEALFSGAPVVTTAGGVFPEAAGPGSAYVAPTDVDGLRQTVAALLGDQVRRDAMRAAGLLHARRFTDQAIAEGLSNVYQEVSG
jgi:glycosyltransferase involved in cell wall biosynthesis